MSDIVMPPDGAYPPWDEPNDDPMQDPGYQEFLAECAKDCRCCYACACPPCAGVTAGGFCDAMCFCGRERYEDMNDREDPEPNYHDIEPDEPENDL